ncbi:hypothetical protein PPERSA_05305 [Pseudocohnilembus persalinus]|uniref:Uncharacterized protein n=1 Tax=Pseudocohnilembus persalinus TaxID=266149 RepID=A0A0V0R614_PSEPJ|nr:hypothetical protein PPERSA_05305 [Pseudocohnilembus persalinus]|eukprot:KRX09913.1 hypothetical protein PPERSA_05305 [Pseudocohnilembus persalinus]
MNPAYQSHILEYFPKLTNLDDLQIDQNVHQCLDFSNRITSRFLVLFLYYVDQDFQQVDAAINKLNMHIELNQVSNKFSQNNQNIPPFRILEVVNQKQIIKLQNLLESSYTIRNQKSASSIAFSVFLYRIIDEMMSGYAQKYAHIEGELENRKQFNEIYQKLFQSLMLNYSSKYNKNLQTFLNNLIQQNPNYDKNLLKNDPQYLMNCLVLEFYHLAPNQSHFNDLHIPDHENPLLIQKPLYYNTYQEKCPNHLNFLDKDNNFTENRSFQTSQANYEQERFQFENSKKINNQVFIEHKKNVQPSQTFQKIPLNNKPYQNDENNRNYQFLENRPKFQPNKNIAIQTQNLEQSSNFQQSNSDLEVSGVSVFQNTECTPINKNKQMKKRKFQ